ncbi:MAG: ATP-binding protein [Flavobacterium sp.]
MNKQKSSIHTKVFISYLSLALLVVIAGWVLYSENKVFSETESKIIIEKNKILKVSSLLSNLYETESLARITIQSSQDADFTKYKTKTESLKTEIDSLKTLLRSKDQILLLDSVKILLSQKTQNILQLKAIKKRTSSEITIKNTIDTISKMESNLRRLEITDFVKDPSKLGNYQLSVLKRYVSVLNQNIPNDSTNTLSQKTLDSMLIRSKILLNKAKTANEDRNLSLNKEEQKLLNNELSISAQLRKILNVIEKEIIITTAKNNAEKENGLQKTNKIVTIAAVVGLLLTVFFSLLILNDFSKSQSYKQQLENANLKTQNLLKNREQLISTVSHDLKTPLSTIIGYTELLGHSKINDKQSYYTKNIQSASNYIAQLVQDLLDFTQIESGKITPENIPFSLSTIIDEVAASIQSLHEKKQIQLIIENAPEAEGKIMGDPFRLRQILTNLIGNAYKFTPKGFIKISTKFHEDSNTITIQIQDSGIGIKTEHQKLIFNEFTQANPSIEKKYGGTGLGLTISKKITQILGGNLTLQSTFGEGSAFQVEIPLVYAVSVEKNNTIVLTPDKSYTILVVDDDNSLLQLTTEILRKAGFNALAFSNANQALEDLKTLTFDLIITDIQMPGIDGFEFLEALQKTEKPYYNQQPVIAVTGMVSPDRAIYTEAGFNCVIPKPYSPETIVNTVKSILFNTTISEQTAIKTSSSNLFNLEVLHSFFPNDSASLSKVVESFLENTQTNLTALEQAFTAHDTEQIKEIAHRIGPMFRQIQAHEVSKILEEVESENLSQKSLEMQLSLLKESISKVFMLLKKEII